MKKLLLPLLAAALALPATATEPAAEVIQGCDALTPTVMRTARGIRAAAVDSRYSLKSLPTVRPTFTTVANPYQFSPARAVASDGTFTESFEGWDQTTAAWLPEGWTMESHGDATLKDNEKWGLSVANPMLPAPSDGVIYAGISFATAHQDEWLITPVIEVKGNMILTFDAYIEPLFLFQIDNIDWSTGEFVGERKVAATMQIMAKAEGETEWTKIWDAADQYAADLTATELMELAPSGLEQKAVSIADYHEKKAQFAFRYVGTDGNTMFVDNVRVGYPVLDDVSYATPLNTLYWGYDEQPGWGAMGLRIAQYGIKSPITFENTSPYGTEACTWTYMDPVTNQMVNSTDAALTVEYEHDYTSDFTTRNNMYYPVTLTAQMPGASPGTYSMAIDYMQAGGRAEFMSSNAGLWQGGLLPYEPNTDGATYLSHYVDFGVMETPITGYDANADAYWYSQTFPGEDNPEYDVYVDGIINAIYPSAGAPLMVEGAHVLALGQLAQGANPTLKLAVYPLMETGEVDFGHPLSEATCEAADMIVYNPGANNLDFYTIPFSFTNPIVLDDSRIGYIVVFSGFHASGFDYFAPVQSKIPNVDNYVLSYLLKQIKYESDSYRTSLSPLAYIDGEYGPCFNSFAINLVGHYGWLRCDVEEVTLPTDGTPVTVALDSYHPAENLAVSELPGLESEVTGRYGNTVLTLRHSDAAVVVNGNVTVSVPGHEVTIKVTETGAGVDDELVADPDAVITGVYTVSGQSLGTAMPSDAGIYIVRYSDGSSRKLVVK